MQKAVPLSKPKAQVTDNSFVPTAFLKSPEKACECDQAYNKSSKVVHSFKPVKVSDIPFAETDIFPVVTITLTSPDGVNKSLLNRDRSFKKSLRVKVRGIPTSKSDFWLPTVPTVPSQAPERPKLTSVKQKDNETSTAKDENILVPKPPITELQQLKFDILEMHKVMKINDFSFAEKRDVLHACKTLDDKWIAVSKNSIMCFREVSSTFCCVSIQDIAYIWVDTNYLLISFELVPGSEIGLIEAITGEAEKTESLISSVMFASSRLADCARMPLADCQIELKVKEVAEHPMCTKIMKDIFKGEKVILSTIAYYETIQTHSQISNEFSVILKERMNSAALADLIIIGKTLKIRSTNARTIGGQRVGTVQSNDNSWVDFNDIEICLDDFVISKAQDGECHKINLQQKSTETYIQLLSNNETAFSELMWRLQFLKDSPQNAPKQLVYLIVTEHSLCLFSVKTTKQLLMRSLLLNLVSISQTDEYSCLITFDGEEMEESTSGKTVWRKISFLLPLQNCLFYEIMKSKVDSNMTQDF